MSVLFLGSGPFGIPCLERLAAMEPALEVATVPDAPGKRRQRTATIVKSRARDLGLPCREVATLKGDAGPRLLQETGAELVIVSDFRLILRRWRGPRGNARDARSARCSHRCDGFVPGCPKHPRGP